MASVCGPAPGTAERQEGANLDLWPPGLLGQPSAGHHDALEHLPGAPPLEHFPRSTSLEHLPLEHLPWSTSPQGHLPGAPLRSTSPGAPLLGHLPWSTSLEHLPWNTSPEHLPWSTSTPSPLAASKWVDAGQEDAGEALGGGRSQAQPGFPGLTHRLGMAPRPPDPGSLPARRTLVPGWVGGGSHTSRRVLSTACECETASSSSDRREPGAPRGRRRSPESRSWEAAAQPVLFQTARSLPHRLLKSDGQTEGRLAPEVAGSAGCPWGPLGHTGVSSAQPDAGGPRGRRGG